LGETIYFKSMGKNIYNHGFNTTNFKPANFIREISISNQFSLFPMESRIVLLGMDMPVPDPNSSAPSVAIITGNFSYIVDCGPGIVRDAVHTSKKFGLKGLLPKNLRTQILTHLYGDHTVGNSDLILTTWVVRRNKSLKVIGPKGTLDMTKQLLEAYKEDIKERINGLEHCIDRGCHVKAKEITPGIVFEDNRLKVEAFEVNHGSWPSFGLILEVDYN